MDIDGALLRELRRIAGSSAPARAPTASLRPLERPQVSSDSPLQRPLAYAGASRMMQTPEPLPRLPLSVGCVLQRPCRTALTLLCFARALILLSVVQLRI